MPRGIYPRKAMRKHTDVTDESIEGREREVSVADIAINGPASPSVEPLSMLNATALENEVFMNQILEVHVHEPQNDTDNKFAFVGVNRPGRWIPRGSEVKLRRCEVAVLASAKTGRVKQVKRTAPDGSQSFVETEVLSMAYPFTVLSDPSPKGNAWLREIMKQAG